MKKINLILCFLSFSLASLFAQNAETGIQGRIVDENKEPVSCATISLFNASDSTLAKAGYSTEDGSFIFTHIALGAYYLNVSFVGYDVYSLSPIEVSGNEITNVQQISMSPFATELGEVVVTTTRPLVEVKPDKTEFNVEGSSNAIGNNALELLRKAPGVVIDNNER